MSVLTDLVREIETYPRDHLKLEIVEVEYSGSSINEEEAVTFRIQATNTGPLDMNQLSLLLEGLPGTLVKEGNGAASPWGDRYRIPGDYFGDVPADSQATVVSQGSPYTFKATSASSNPRDLIRVSVAGWDAPYMAHSRKDAAANVVYSSTVAGD